MLKKTTLCLQKANFLHLLFISAVILVPFIYFLLVLTSSLIGPVLSPVFHKNGMLFIEDMIKLRNDRS